MITPFLEKLIWEGKAASRSWATGGGAVSRIPVKKNSFIIIHSITWHPINTDVNQAAGGVTSVNQCREGNTHGLFLYTNKKRWYHNFRAAYTAVIDPGGSGSVGLLPGPAVRLESLYIPFNENVRVNVIHIRNTPETWGNPDYTPMLDSSDEMNIAESYQTASGPVPLPTLKGWDFGIAGEASVYPTADQSPLAAINQADAFYEFKNKGGTIAMPDPTAYQPSEANGFNYPLINFDYIEIFQTMPEGMLNG